MLLQTVLVHKELVTIKTVVWLLNTFSTLDKLQTSLALGDSSYNQHFTIVRDLFRHLLSAPSLETVKIQLHEDTVPRCTARYLHGWRRRSEALVFPPFSPAFVTLLLDATVHHSGKGGRRLVSGRESSRNQSASVGGHRQEYSRNAVKGE